VPPKLRGAVLPDPLPVHIVVRALSTTRRTKRAAQIYRASRLQHRRTAGSDTAGPHGAGAWRWAGHLHFKLERVMLRIEPAVGSAR
jgi:hypothetical protein